VATGQSFSGYIRHSASRAARPTEKGIHHSTASLLRGNLRENGDESGHSPYAEGVYHQKKERDILLLKRYLQLST
ncbi:MAG: hypothetical protein SGI98_10995, partial [Verrucomicrobiota bacterium]|nr:hypothetical protein [Verrucomicrobiota bacterium]